MKKKSLSIIIVCAAILLIIVLAGTVFLIRRYSPNKEHKDLNSYYGLASNDEVAIILNDEVTDAKAKVIDGHIYLDYSFLHDELNSRFYWDQNENILLYATARDLISAAADSSSYLVTKSSVDYGHPVVKANADHAYVDLEFANEYSDFEYKYVKDPHRIVITNQWGDYETASLKRNSSIRFKGGVKSPILKDAKAKEEVSVLETGDKWTKVMTEDGIIG